MKRGEQSLQAEAPKARGLLGLGHLGEVTCAASADWAARKDAATMPAPIAERSRDCASFWASSWFLAGPAMLYSTHPMATAGARKMRTERPSASAS